MVGGYALRYPIDHQAVGSVTAIGRKKLGVKHAKLREMLHADFVDCSTLLNVLTGQGVAVFCLGTYTGKVSDADSARLLWTIRPSSRGFSAPAAPACLSRS